MCNSNSFERKKNIYITRRQLFPKVMQLVIMLLKHVLFCFFILVKTHILLYGF